MKQTIHDGSRSYSITIPDPEPGKGKQAKTPAQAYRRHIWNLIRRMDIEKVIKNERG